MTYLVQNHALREAFKRGERSAMARVYQVYAKGLFVMLQKGFVIKTKAGHFTFTGYKEAFKLEGAAQDVFVRAFSESARTGYDGLRPFKNYLYTIARNRVVDSFRKGKKEFVAIDELPPETAKSALDERFSMPQSPEELAVWKQLKEQVDEFIGSLNAAEQALFQVRFLNGQSVEATSKELKISEYRVKRDEKRIKKRFFYWMKKNGYFEGYRFGDTGLEQYVVLVFAILRMWESC